MSRFTHCPGEECESKVKIIELNGREEINFCCVPCFEFTWASIKSEAEGMAHEHSGQCGLRREARRHKSVIHGEFVIHTPDWKTPPIGGTGGPKVS